MVRIAGFGDNDVDCYLSDGRMYPGGNCFNVAVFAARAGATAGFVGAVAEDAAGRLMRDALAAEGVDTARLRVVPGLTAYCVIGHADGERQFLHNDLGVSRFVPEAADFDYLAGFDAVHVGQSSGLDDWLERVAAVSRLSYDFALRREPDHLARVAPLCWLATLSAGDLEADAAEALGRQAAEAGAVWTLVTRGEEGALLLGPDGLHRVAAPRVRPVDTLGAGDSFVARLLVGLVRGEAPEAALSAAAIEASVTCGHVGAVGHGLPIDLPVALPEALAQRLAALPRG